MPTLRDALKLRGSLRTPAGCCRLILTVALIVPFWNTCQALYVYFRHVLCVADKFSLNPFSFM